MQARDYHSIAAVKSKFVLHCSALKLQAAGSISERACGLLNRQLTVLTANSLGQPAPKEN